MKDAAWTETAKQRLLNVAPKPTPVMVSGEGMRLRDDKGREYLDYIGGWAVNSLGHSPEVLKRAVAEQAGRLINASPAFYNEPQLCYAELLVGNCVLDKVFFTSTGAEANESAIKLARKYGLRERGGATEIITTEHSFHGRTMLTMAATGKAQWETLYGDKLPGFRKARFNDLESVRSLVGTDTCAIMVEPVQGEGGVNVATQVFMDGLREICDEHGLLLIFDEVQTGMGRTGRLFAYEHYAVTPDIMTLGKGIGGGFPLSAMLARDWLDIFEPGDQGGTYTGQPLAMAAGMAVLKTMLAPGFLEHVAAMGDYTRSCLRELGLRYELGNIRGLGLLQAFDLEQSNAGEVVDACLDDGLILNSPRPQTIRLIPPLIVEQAEVDEMLRILRRHLRRRA